MMISPCGIVRSLRLELTKQMYFSQSYMRNLKKLQTELSELQIDLIVSSPLRRALQTCFYTGILSKIPKVIVSELCSERIGNEFQSDNLPFSQKRPVMSEV